jgi:hypothetical protein
LVVSSSLESIDSATAWSRSRRRIRCRQVFWPCVYGTCIVLVSFVVWLSSVVLKVYIFLACILGFWRPIARWMFCVLFCRRRRLGYFQPLFSGWGVFLFSGSVHERLALGITWEVGVCVFRSLPVITCSSSLSRCMCVPLLSG